MSYFLPRLTRSQLTYLPLFQHRRVGDQVARRVSSFLGRSVSYFHSRLIYRHGVTLGGVVVSGGNFEWAGNPRFPELNEPFAGYHGLILTKQFGRHAFLAKMRMETQREMGATLSAQSAFQLLQGIETLPLRVDRHTSNSLALARWLEAHPKVLWVSHPSLKSHPSYEFAKKLLKRGAGGTLAFALKPVGDKPSDIVAQEWIDATLLAVHAPNLGGKLSTALLQAIRRLLVSRSRSSSFLDVRTLVVSTSSLRISPWLTY